MVKLIRRLGIAVLALVLFLAVVFGAAVIFLSKKLPVGESGPRADELAHAIERNVNTEAWQKTGAVRWTFGGRNQHLWDRTRMLARVRWKDGTSALVNLTTQQGRAFDGNTELTGERASRLVKRAYASWINDSFWLNPLVKLFDDGTVRKIVPQPDGSQALLLSYMGGGLTPGDSYLWLLGPDGKPRAWQMFVSIIPIKGVEASWEGWTQLATGAWVSTRHKAAGITLELSDVAGAATLAELEPGADPFAALGN